MFHEEGFMTKEQHDTFVKYGSTATDVDEMRFLAVDMTLFTPGGETSFVDHKELKAEENDKRAEVKDEKEGEKETKKGEHGTEYGGVEDKHEARVNKLKAENINFPVRCVCMCVCHAYFRMLLWIKSSFFALCSVFMFYVHLQVRERTVKWVEEQLREAEHQGKKVFLVMHQPLATKKGKDELDIEGEHFGRIKELLVTYQHIIRAGFFGHRNLAGVQEILSPLGAPIIPSITVPGVSPRGRNQPCFNVVYLDKKDHYGMCVCIS
jgi:hypothetical protein